jgi:hypothetical protein
VEPLLARGRRSFKSGDYATAETTFRSVLQLDPGNVTARRYVSFITQIPDEE